MNYLNLAGEQRFRQMHDLLLAPPCRRPAPPCPALPLPSSVNFLIARELPTHGFSLRVCVRLEEELSPEQLIVRWRFLFRPSGGASDGEQ